MPRPRLKDRDLPQGVYRHGRRYRMRVVIDDKPAWKDLGSDKEKAIQEWRRVMGQPAGNISALMDRYLAEELAEGKKAAKTIKEQRRQMEKLRSVFGHLRPAELRATHAITYLDRRGQVAPIAANREIALLRHLATKLVHWGELEYNPIRGLQYRNKETPRQVDVSNAQLCAALRCRHALVRRVSWLVYLTGLRRADALGLTRFNVHADGLHLVEGKTRKKVKILWSSSLQKVVKRLLADSVDSRLFPITVHGFESAWRRFMARQPQRWQLKDLRARHASDWEDAGHDATHQLGHADRKTTLRHYLRRGRKVTPIR